MTAPSLPPGYVCDAKTVQRVVDPRITHIDDRDHYRLGRRICIRCGRRDVIVRQEVENGQPRRWYFEAHLVPQDTRPPRSPANGEIPGIVTREAFEEAFAQCDSQQQMATHLSVSLRTLQRAYDRYRPGERPDYRAPRLTDAHKRVIADRTADGMPAKWIAEDLPYSLATVTNFAQGLPARTASIAEWRAVWSDIKRDPRMLELHRELAPKRRAMSSGNSSREDRDHPRVRRLEAAA